MSKPILVCADRGAGDIKGTALAVPDTSPHFIHPKLTPEKTTFFKAQTGIDDDEALKSHILQVQAKAHKVFPYPCIQLGSFLEYGMAALPVYDSVLKLGRERPNGILLDIGACCVDARKAAADGFPLRNIVTTDLYQEFFDLGHELFRTTPASYPISFVAGDMFKPEVLQILPPLDGLPPTERPNLSTLTSLDPLAGHCVAIYAGNVFHLFSEENQLHLAKGLAGLLSPVPGSMIFGKHACNLQKGVVHIEYGGKAVEGFCHSPESWAATWDGEVFDKGKVRVDTTLEWVDKEGLAFWKMRWSVLRL